MYSALSDLSPRKFSRKQPPAGRAAVNPQHTLVLLVCRAARIHDPAVRSLGEPPDRYALILFARARPKSLDCVQTYLKYFYLGVSLVSRS